MSSLTAWEKLKIVHNPKRPNAKTIIKYVFENYYELEGDRFFGEDKVVSAGIAEFKDIAVRVILALKGMKNII